jgi:hypothetical protein
MTAVLRFKLDKTCDRFVAFQCIQSGCEFVRSITVYGIVHGDMT